MRETDHAQMCIDKLNGMQLHGRTLRVDFSATAKPHNPTPGEYMGARRPLRQSKLFIHWSNVVADRVEDERPPPPRDHRRAPGSHGDRYEGRTDEMERRRVEDRERDRRDDRYGRDDRDRRPASR